MHIILFFEDETSYFFSAHSSTSLASSFIILPPKLFHYKHFSNFPFSLSYCCLDNAFVTLGCHHISYSISLHQVYHKGHLFIISTSNSFMVSKEDDLQCYSSFRIREVARSLRSLSSLFAILSLIFTIILADVPYFEFKGIFFLLPYYFG